MSARPVDSQSIPELIATQRLSLRLGRLEARVAAEDGKTESEVGVLTERVVNLERSLEEVLDVVESRWDDLMTLVEKTTARLDELSSLKDCVKRPIEDVDHPGKRSKKSDS